MRYRTDKQLVSHNEQNATYNYKYTFSVEIVPICKVLHLCHAIIIMVYCTCGLAYNAHHTSLQLGVLHMAAVSILVHKSQLTRICCYTRALSSEVSTVNGQCWLAAAAYIFLLFNAASSCTSSHRL